MQETSWIKFLDDYTREFKEKLQVIKNNSVLEEKWREITIAKNSFGYGGKLGELTRARPNSVAYNSLIEYLELLEELESLSSETAKKSNEERRKSKNKQNDKTNTLLKKSKQFSCDECGITKKGKYKHHKTKKDGQKFCSDNCFYTHYAEKCDNCLEKCLKYSKGKAIGEATTYYSDGINMTGTLCSKCHTEKLKEETQEKKKDKEWEENCKKLDKAMDDLVDGMVEAVEKGGEEEESDNTNIDNSNNNKKDDNSINNNSNSIERERERESKILLNSSNYFLKSAI